MREIEAVEQVVNAAFIVNGKLTFDKLTRHSAGSRSAFQAAFKRGFQNNRVFEGKFLSSGRFRADRRSAKSRETFPEREFEKTIDGVFIE